MDTAITNMVKIPLLASNLFVQVFIYQLQRKYGVVVLVGITLSESGTALKRFAWRLSVSVIASTAAMFPQR